MNIASTIRDFTPIRMNRHEAEKLLQSRSQTVTLGEHEFEMRSEALAAIGDSVTLPCHGLKLTQKATASFSPDVRRNHLKQDAWTPGTVTLGAAATVAGVGGVAMLSGQLPLWVGLGLTAAGLGFGVLSALEIRSGLRRAEEMTGADDYTMTETRIEEYVLPDETGDGLKIVGSGNVEANFYVVGPDKQDNDIMVFAPISAGHHSVLSGSAVAPHIYDIVDGKVISTGPDGSTGTIG